MVDRAADSTGCCSDPTSNTTVATLTPVMERTKRMAAAPANTATQPTLPYGLERTATQERAKGWPKEYLVFQHSSLSNHPI